MIEQDTIIRFMRDRLEAYAVAQFPEFRPAKHQQVLASKLEAIERGEVRRLIVTLPPRHGKSKMSSELFPSWFLGRNPSKRVLLLT